MSGVGSGIPLEVPQPRASDDPALSNLYFFITILRQFCEDMPEVVVRTQIVQFCGLRNAVNKSTVSCPPAVLWKIQFFSSPLLLAVSQKANSNWYAYVTNSYLL